jgi:hypothetical protein
MMKADVPIARFGFVDMRLVGHDRTKMIYRVL